jgi:hypothetical protein
VQAPASVSPTSARHTNQAFSVPADGDEEP